VVRTPRGASRLGCLVSLLLAVTIAYFGFNIGEVYLRFFRLKDAMTQEARFAHNRDDNAIRLRLAAVVDSLGLPDAAGRVIINRDAGRIVIKSVYSEHVELPLFVREFHFEPQVVRRF
jgi:hypothetical protein